MAQPVSTVIHFKGIDIDEEVRDHLTERCGHLADEFPETTRYELTLQSDANNGFEASCHVSGKKTSAAAHIKSAENPRQAGDQVLDKLERELRKDHDKRIFTPRRKAQKAQTKRMS
jgi:ribosome-associated translation inhibitor RaiA